MSNDKFVESPVQKVGHRPTQTYTDKMSVWVCGKNNYRSADDHRRRPYAICKLIPGWERLNQSRKHLSRCLARQHRQ